MLGRCFTTDCNPRGHEPTCTELFKPPEGDRFEERAFAALYRNRRRLGFWRLWRCHAARVDGFLQTLEGELVMVEVKEVLGWGSVSGGVFEMLAGRKLLRLRARRGILVFQRISQEWSEIAPHGGWGQLALHAQEVAPHIQLGGLQVTEAGRVVAPRVLRGGGRGAV